ncbi:hypothetical protein N7468_001688 [Penicillium chermesinum]|uniref:UBL3-like ubiquitin domain-containing protein n=1 Tax=Penicillium chermesinum TaxID=63820 RepID=A0A9W9PHA0_9EURO|nr:uncharacterized protein N7468_001688 [Penicillium chermesinum]KAJ5246705.1 hypothetical protein N7468_001688 [Penicillium chermesinum]KAJ6144976.1 hypothetical protein N7470_008871 [Penicillium chermesinum]
MSLPEHPDSGPPNPSLEPRSGASTADGQSATPATDSSTATQVPSSTATPIPTGSSGNAPSGDASSDDTVHATQTAAGGESSAPVQEHAPTAATGANTPVVQPPIPETSPMSTEEPKAGAEPSTEQSDVEGKEAEDTGPALHITLLLTTGSRHPFTIDGKYLRKRSVNVENYDPFAMSVYTLKELIWREWRSDWEPRPSSPSSIRLISFGKLLDDKSPLSESRFNHDAPNVVHMTVKPQEVVDEEDAKGTKAQYSRERVTSERSPGCRCVIL